MLKIATILLAALLVTSAHSTESHSIQIQSEPHLNVLPTQETASKKIFVSFEGSPMMTTVVMNKLEASGLNVASNPESAEVNLRITGMYMVSGGGKESSSGPLGEMLEKSVKAIASTDPDYHHQNISLTQILVTKAFMGAISVTDMVRWLSQKAGIAGRVNEAITGDPRGFCWHESCRKLTSTIIFRVSGNGFNWWIKLSAQSEHVVLDLVVAEALEKGLQPILNLGSQTISVSER